MVDEEKTATPIKAAMILLSIKDPKFETELAASPQEGKAEGTRWHH